MARLRRDPWVQLTDLHRAEALLILPCNAAACVGNYFWAEVYRASGWNTWREADALLRDLREEGRVAFAAVDSSTLETAPEDPRGAIVLETEMERATSPDGEDWGAPSWRWFRPTRQGGWNRLISLTRGVMRGVRRINEIGFEKVFGLVNPHAYFLALASAVKKCGLLDSWVLFRIPAHPRHLITTVRDIGPFVRAAVNGAKMPGGIYAVPKVLPSLKRELRHYREVPPSPWGRFNLCPELGEAQYRWEQLRDASLNR